MTLVLRVVDPPQLADLGAAGLCRVSLCEVVAKCGSGSVVSIVYLGEWIERAA